ncbi:MAG: TonB-dependent receptor plug domain-containing protein [Opitutaceae bacterium]|nr:TonB-dependent receptor plug domain-containing protein [Opitutaceae bacterium]
MKARPCSFFAAAAAAFVIIAPSLHAQATVPAKPVGSEPVEVLSPFVVQSEKDTGYQASSTLAGTRLNTPVKELAASISIYTKDLIDDLGATNASDLLVFATGMDVAGAGGNYSGANNDINEARPNGNAARIDPQGTSRSRGLGSPTFTRGYFGTTIPFDSYNTGTVTVNRGPNAALFGVGSAAGVVDTALLEPEFRGNKYSVSLRYGNNDSLRASTDFNLVLVPRKVAFRLASLREREEFNQRPAFEDKRRIYGALTIKPTTTTVLRANFESGRINANRPLISLPYNSVPAPWYAAGRPSYDWRAYDDPAYNGPHGTATEGFFFSNSITLGPTYVYSNPTDRAPSIGFMSTTPSTTANAANAVKTQVFHPIANRNLLTDSIRFLHTQNIFDFPAGYWTAANVPPGQLPGFVPAGIKAQGFTDFSAFDFKNRLIDESSRQDESFHAFNVRLEQSFWQNRAGLSLAYDTQRIDRRSRNSFFSINNANHIFLDTSVTLPNGQANPNLGRPYAVYGLSNWRDRFEAREGGQATGFLRYDFKDLKAGWARWLGRHSLTGLYEESRTDLLEQRPVTSTLGDALDASTSGDLGINVRRPGIIVYMGPSIIGNNNPLRLQPIQIPQIQAGATIPVSYFRRAGNATDPGDFVSAPSTLIELAGPGTAAREVIKSQAFVLQSYWLSDHFITTLSWRRDEDFSANQSTAYRVNPADRLDPGRARFGFGDFELFDRQPPPYVSKEIKSYGAVLRWPQRWLKLPAGSDVSVFINRSENFTPLGGRISPFGVSWDSPQGETREYGFNFSTLNDKFSVRLNRFETAIKGASFSWSNFTAATVNNIFGAAAAWAVEGNINPQMAAQRNADIELLFSALPANYRELHSFRINGTAPNISVSGILNTGLAGATDTTDTTAKGLEADFVFNPTPRWRIMMNVAKQETVQSNSLPFMKSFVALMKPTFDKLANTPRGNYPTGYVPGSPLPPTTLTYGQWLDANLYVPLATALATEGSVSAEQRKWRVNLVTNYTFGSEPFLGLPLKGFALGAGVRWQDKFALGYPTTRKPDGGVLIDIARPYYGPDDLNVDLFASYGRPIFGGKIRWKAQLNVRNAIGRDSLLPVTVQPWGEVATTRLAPERRWYLTNTFSF